MKTYIKTYRYRVTGIVMVALLSFMAVFIISVMFKNRLNEISNQLESYNNSDYSVAYVLNYGLLSDNEFVFPDTDIQLYLDEAGTERLAVSCLMPQKGSNYSIEELNSINTINDGEVIVSKNVADRYDLEVGDTIYVQYPYSSSLIGTYVSEISRTEYDYENPNIANGIGIVYVAYDEKYVESTKCKYLIFSETSLAKELSEHPQILSGVINKNKNQEEVLSQGIHILIFETIFLAVAMIISFQVFFSRSFALLKRLYLKGEKQSILTVIPLLERLIWWVIPCLIGMMVNMQIIPCNSELTKVFYLIPLLYAAFFVVAVWIYDCIKTH